MLDQVGGPEAAELIALRREVATLIQAVQTNRVIGVAIGLVMAEHHLTREQAFGLLVAQSQNTNTKLAWVAAQLVALTETATTATAPTADTKPAD